MTIAAIRELVDKAQRFEISAAADSEGPAQAARFRMLSAAEVAASPPIQWLVRGVLPRHGIGAIYGPSGSGKTFLGLDLLGAVASGRQWFDCKSHVAPVTLVALEGEAGLSQRLAAYRSKYASLPTRMQFITEPFNLMDADDVLDLAVSIRDHGGVDGVVCVDTLNRAMPGADENSSADMGRAIDGAKRLQGMLGGLVLLVHHTGKDVAKGLRGHSSLFAALDVAIEVIRDHNSDRAWMLAKAKDGADGDLHPFRLEVFDLGVDADGERVTSCAVDSGATGVERRKPAGPTGGNQKVAWDLIGTLLRQTGDARPEGAPADLPTGRPAIPIELAIEAIAPRLVCDPKRRRERAMEAIRGLVGRGLLCFAEEWVWCS